MYNADWEPAKITFFIWLFTSAEEVVFATVGWFCPSFSNFTQSVLNGLAWKFQKMLESGYWTYFLDIGFASDHHLKPVPDFPFWNGGNVERLVSPTSFNASFPVDIQIKFLS